MIVGITGASGSGKSTAAGIFVKSGFYLIDCDAVSRELNSSPEYVSRIADVFGSEFITDGAVDRRKLGDHVFGSADMLGLLNAVSHPMIIKKIEDEIAAHDGDDILIDAPLLFESGLDSLCDVTVGVTAPDEDRIDRVIFRDGVDYDTAKKRVTSQQPNDYYVSHCDIVIENDSTEDELDEKTYDAIGKIRTLESGVGKRTMSAVCWMLIVVAFILSVVFAVFTLSGLHSDDGRHNGDATVYITSQTTQAEQTTVTSSTVEATEATPRAANFIDIETVHGYAVKYGTEYGVDTNLIMAIIKRESSFNANAVSRSDARGLMQIKPSTYLGEIYLDLCAEDDPELLFDAEFNVKCGTYYLHLLHDRYDIVGIEQLAAAYNGGVTEIKKWLDDENYSPDGVTLYTDRVPNQSVKNYIRWVRGSYNEYVGIYGDDPINDFE